MQGPAQVDHEGDGHEQIAQEAGEDGRAGECLVLRAAEDEDQGGDGEAAGGQRHTGVDVHGDPQAPGVLIAEVGGRAQTHDVAVDGRGNARGHEHQKRPGPRRDDP